MADEPIPTTGGATGEPATPEAVSSQPQSDEALLASLDQAKGGQPDPDADFWKQLAEKDISKAPPEIRSKIEAPFLSLSSKKIQDVEQKYQQRLDQLVGTVDRLVARDGAPAGQPNIREELRQKIAEGDFTAVEGLVDAVFQEKYGTQMNFITGQQTITNAANLLAQNEGPDLGKFSAAVTASLQNDQDLAYLSMANNGRFGPKILAGLAFQHGYYDEKAKRMALEASIADREKKAVERYKAELKGLPTSTSKAGSTPTAFTPDKPMTLDEIRDAAWAAGGGH